MAFLIDIKYALRLLLKSPKFTFMTVGVLVGGLAISLFTFSFLYTSVYKPLPLPGGDETKRINVLINGESTLITDYEYLQIKDNLSSLAEFGIYDNRDVRLSVEESGKNYSASYVRGGFFEFSQVKPLMGRYILSSDTLSGADPVAVISYAVWQSDLQGDDKVLSRTLMLNGIKTQVVGVMPQGYRFPNTSKVWLPLADDVLSDSPKDASRFIAFGRIKPEFSLTEAQNELAQALNQLYQQNVRLYDLPAAQKSAEILTFQMAQTGGQGGVAFGFLNLISWSILLLACINVGNLLLARSVERQKETAIRSALGATQGRLISQLMWEGILISVTGGILAVLLAGAALDYTNMALNSWIPSGGSFWWDYGMDGATLLMAVVFTLVTIVLAAFLPAWRSANQNINSALRDGTRGAQGKKVGRISKMLVTVQVFLVATLMLIGSISAFIAHKFINLELGDNYHDLMSARFVIPEQKYPADEQKLNLLSQLTEQVLANPSVTGVLSNNWMGNFELTLNDKEKGKNIARKMVDAISIIGSTDTAGVSLVAGRQLTHMDNLNARKVAIISQSMANRYWPGQSAIDRDFVIKINDVEHRLFVVGVVTDRMNPGSLFGKLDSQDEVYVSGMQFVSGYQVFHYRILPNTQGAEEIFYQAMFNTDPNLELTYAVQPAIENRNKMRESMQVLSNVTFATGIFALLLALVGIHGLTANSVAQRTHEVGIRRAVGATDNEIINMFLRQGAKQLFIGLGLALVLYSLMAYGFHQFTEQLFPIYMYFSQALAVTIGLSLVVMIAIYSPTKRAVNMEPSNALRYE